MLVVRVKRNREDDPADTICLVEGSYDQNGGAKKRKKVAFGDLSVKSATNQRDEEDNTGNASQSEIRNRLILKRVSTIDRSSQNTTLSEESTFTALTSKKSLDEDTITLLRKRNEEDLNSQANLSTPTDDQSRLQRKRMKVIVAQNKRALPIEGSESCIIVDMTQVFQPPPPPESEKKENVKSSGTKILDPATRLLRQGILSAVSRNDFNDISSALIKGADANYRLDDKDGGYTALMVAAMKGNVRMVKRLLLNQVDVTVQNKDGVTALDLVKKPTRSTQKDCDEIKQAIQQAMVKVHYQRKVDVSTGRGQGKASSTVEADYVYDVYCVDAAFSKESEPLKQTNEDGEDELGVASDAAVVKIDGLKILDDGQVELFQYDSDWSDLADDEDPDSNDERYYANDYPDEDSGDENGGRYFDNDDDASYSSDEEARRASKTRYRHSATTTSRTSKYANVSSYSDKKQPRQARDRFNDGSDDDVNDEEDEGGDDVDDENALIDAQLEDIVNRELGGGSANIFDRHSSVGKVLKPHYIGGGGGGGGREQWSELDPPRHLDSETLRQIWDEDVADDVTPKTSHEQRVYDMRQRTNMLFASNPREFDADGMPRFGAELSDDEANQPFTDATMMMDEDERPDRSAVAYDPDLDRDSD